MAATPQADEPVGIDDYAKLPDDGYRTELVRGRVVREPQAGYRHGNTQTRLAAILLRHIDEHNLDLVCVGPVGFVLQRDPPTVRGPDLAILHRARIPCPDHAGFIDEAPDLAIEIGSPSNAPAEIEAKVLDYLNAGARQVWAVYPETRTCVVHQPTARARSLGSENALDGGDVLPGLRLDLPTIFRR